MQIYLSYITLSEAVSFVFEYFSNDSTKVCLMRCFKRKLKQIFIRTHCKINLSY